MTLVDRSSALSDARRWLPTVQPHARDSKLSKSCIFKAISHVVVAALWQPMSVLIACADAALGSDIMCSPCTLIVFASGLRSTDFVDVSFVNATSYGLVRLHVMSHYRNVSTVCVGPIVSFGLEPSSKLFDTSCAVSCSLTRLFSSRTSSLCSVTA